MLAATCDWMMQSRDSHVSDCWHWRLHASDAGYRHVRLSCVLVTGTLATIAPLPAATCDWLMQ